MNVVVHPADSGGCGSYRLTWPAEALAAQGHDVTVGHDAVYQALWQPSVFGEQVVGVVDPPDADVVVFQRPLARHRYEFIGALQAHGVAVVVEIDDDFHAIHPRNPAWKGTSPLRNPESNRDWLMRACQRADLVTVSTPALAERYGKHGRVAVLPNFVPEWYTRLTVGSYTTDFLCPGSNDLTRVGWSGSVATHPDDLQATGGAMASVLEQTGARFHVVGTGKGVKVALKLRDEPDATGWLPIQAYPEGLKLFDVGIVPLAAREFNDAKSCLKGLEMAAVGVPFVASPAADYRRLAAEGVGWIANTPAEWASLVGLLVRDETARLELAQEWRAQIAEHYTIEGNAWRWAEAWAQAVAFRAERVAA